MTDYPLEVREEAARRANAAYAVSDMSCWDADTIVRDTFGRALCKAVADGLLHVDPEELDQARDKVAKAIADDSPYEPDGNLWWTVLYTQYRRLVREGGHPEPVDPVAEVVASLGLTNPDELAAADVAIRAWIEREAGQ